MSWLPIFRRRPPDTSPIPAFGSGRLGDPLPEGYLNFRSSPAYLGREYNTPHHQYMMAGPAAGARHKNGPFRIDKFYGDDEPEIVPGPRRLIIWQPVVRLDHPSGWWRFPDQTHARRTGFVDLQGLDDLTSKWSSHAKRHFKHWQKQTNWEIVESSLDDFLTAYQRTSMKFSVVYLHKKIMRERAVSHGSHLRWFVAKEKTPNAPISAGFACLDIPEIKQSIHVMSFHHPKAKEASVGTGLVYHWFQTSHDKGLRFLDFDLFYVPGDPKGWMGFSRFKAQFGTQFIGYPNPLVRWGKR